MDSNISSIKDDINYESTKIVDICENSSKIQPNAFNNLKIIFLIFYEKFKCILFIITGIFLLFIIVKHKKKNKHSLNGDQNMEISIKNIIKEEVFKINKNFLEIINQFKSIENKIHTINTTNNFHEKNKTNNIHKIAIINNNITKNNRYLEKYLKMKNYSIPEDETVDCKLHDGFNNFKLLTETESYILCKGEISKHKCYYQYDYDFEKGGALCELENVILDPTKFKYYYSCPDSDFWPDLKDFFFNMKCNVKGEQFSHHFEYDFYFNHWNYNYTKKNEIIEEIGINKTVLIISARSSHLYHGFLEIMNAIAVMNVYNLEPEDVQILLIEKCPPEFDVYYPFYSELISRGGDIIFFNELSKNKKYLIKNAINVPHLYDSPFWVDGLLSCKYRSPAYKRLLHLIAKYLIIPEFHDSLDYNGTIIVYPKSVKNVNDPKYTKFVTIEWRKPFPPDRKNQQRLMGNGQELLNKLQAKMKKNILVRLVDTAYLSIIDQISLMLKTNYLIGIHGAGFTLGPYLSDEAIIHEISIGQFNEMPLSICALSGHRTFKDSIGGYIKEEDGEYMYLNADEFVSTVVSTMKRNNF